MEDRRRSSGSAVRGRHGPRDRGEALSAACRQAFVFALTTLAAFLSFAPPSAAAEGGVRTFRELLEESDLIVVARASGEGEALARGELVVEETLKGEPSPPLRFMVKGPAVPHNARAIWFLRRRGDDGAWIVDNPQNAYDPSHLPIVRAGVRDPAQIRPEYYLRREDEFAAQEARLSEEISELADLPQGAAFRGLALSVESTQTRLAHGETLYLRYTLTNVSSRPLLVCMAETECWHAVSVRTPPAKAEPAAALYGMLRMLGFRRPSPPPPPAPVVRVLRAGPEPLPGEAGLGLGMLVTEHDYILLQPGQSSSVTLGVSGIGSPDGAQWALPTMVAVRGAYRYRHPEAPLVALPRNPWEGAVASESVEIQITR